MTDNSVPGASAGAWRDDPTVRRTILEYADAYHRLAMYGERYCEIAAERLSQEVLAL